MQFYVLNTSHDASESPATTDFLQLEPHNTGPAPRCEACGELVGMRSWLPPHRVELTTWGKAFGDIVSGPSASLLISGRLKTLHQSHGFTGLTGFDPVEVVRVKRHRRFKGEPPLYYHVSVVRSQAVVDDVLSGIVRDGPVTCSVCHENGIVYVRRIALVPSTWRGEDVFFARGLPGKILTSERFKEFCEENGIRNAVLIPVEQYGIDYR